MCNIGLKMTNLKDVLVFMKLLYWRSIAWVWLDVIIYSYVFHLTPLEFDGQKVIDEFQQTLARLVAMRAWARLMN